MRMSKHQKSYGNNRKKKDQFSPHSVIRILLKHFSSNPDSVDF